MLNQSMAELGSKKSCIRELFEYGLRQAAEVGRENVYDYSLGNPSVPAPEKVRKAFEDALKKDPVLVHGYTPAAGRPEARRAVADDLNARYGAGIRPHNLFFTCGAAPALTAVFRALSVPGSEIMAIAPFFPEYRPFAEGAGSRFVMVPADTQNFQINFTSLEALLTPHTQAVIVNSPNNPSGVIYSRATLEKLAALLRERSRQYGHPIYIVSDEPYRELVYDGAEVPFIPQIYENTVVCYSYSKSFSLPGERIGYVCVPDCAADSEELFNAVAGAARADGHVCAPSLQQMVIAACPEVRPDIAEYDKNRRALYDALTGWGYQCAKPQGAFYLFIKAPGGDGQKFSDLAKKKNLLIVPGAAFGCPEFFRISTCVSHDMILRSLPLFRELIEGLRS